MCLYTCGLTTVQECCHHWLAVHGTLGRKIGDEELHFDEQSVGEIHVPLYTTPPQRTWVGLTDEEITELHYEIKVRLMGAYKTEDIYRAIEAKLKEKNNG